MKVGKRACWGYSTHQLLACDMHVSVCRLHMPSVPPPTPVSHGLTSPRYHGALEGMAAPSQRFTGAHHPSGLSLQSYGMPSAYLYTALLLFLKSSSCAATIAA